MASSPPTTARPTSSCTTPPSRLTDSAPCRRTSGSSTPLDAGPRGRRRRKSTRCSTSRHDGAAGGPEDRPAAPSSLLGDRADDGDQAAVDEVRVGPGGGVPGQLHAAQALVPPVAAPREVVHG